MRSCSQPDCARPRYGRGLCELHYNRWRRWGDPQKVATPDHSARSNATPAVARAAILRKITTTDPNACWIWTGARTKAGYGQMLRAGKKVYTHRMAYELFVGPIEAGLVLDHLCRQVACCNPNHLQPVTDLANIRRGRGHGSETHCPHGHPYSGENLIVRKNGCRACRACERAANKRRWQKELARRYDATA